jgi:hypothetical protein
MANLSCKLKRPMGDFHAGKGVSIDSYCLRWIQGADEGGEDL